MDNIIKFPKEFKPTLTSADILTKDILLSADKANLDEVVVIGFDVEGEFYFASSKGDGGAVLWLLEKAKKTLLEYADRIEEGDFNFTDK